MSSWVCHLFKSEKNILAEKLFEIIHNSCVGCEHVEVCLCGKNHSFEICSEETYYM